MHYPEVTRLKVSVAFFLSDARQETITCRALYGSVTAAIFKFHFHFQILPAHLRVSIVSTPNTASILTNGYYATCEHWVRPDASP